MSQRVYTICLYTKQLEDTLKTVLEAKVFKNGGSSAIRLPASLNITEGVVYLEIDEDTGAIAIKRQKPGRLEAFFALQEQLGPIDDDDWMPERSHEPAPIRKSIQELIDAE
jgi:virulence-associated protein VagC